MKTNSQFIPFGFGIVAALLISGCATDGVEKGREGTIAYLVEIESNEPGARVEADGDYVGKTPMTLKIFGDKDGTFHNFGSEQYLIQVFPLRTNQFVQTKVFRTGRWFSQEDGTSRSVAVVSWTMMNCLA